MRGRESRGVWRREAAAHVGTLAVGELEPRLAALAALAVHGADVRQKS